MSKRFLKGLLGIWGSCTVAVIATMAVLMIYDVSVKLTSEILFEIILIRIIHAFVTAPTSKLASRFKDKTIFQTIKSEMRIAIAFFAACYLLRWPLEITTVYQIAIVNFGAQVFWSLSVIGLRLGIQKKYSGTEKITAGRQAIIIGTGKQAATAADMILESINLDTKLIGFVDHNRKELWRYRDIPLIGHTDDLEKIIATNHIDYIVIAVEPSEFVETLPYIARAEKMGISVLLVSELHRPSLAKFETDFFQNQLIAEYSTEKQDSLALFLKSMADRIGALVGLVIISPIMLITALVIKFDSNGPVFFKQVRTGHNGRKFKLWKFRTMVIDAEQKKEALQKQNEMSGPVFKIARDPRITRVGTFLRKYSIDELPQLINVLRGEMSLVGPRPPLPQEVKQFKPWQHRKLSVKPGLTCLWQTNGRNNIDFEEWMKLDLKYIDNWSLWEDAKIIVRTVPTVLKGSGS